jgi:hypothetical protein
MDVRFEQRVNIKFCVKLGKTATEKLQLLPGAYGDEDLSQNEKRAIRAASECQGYSSGCDIRTHKHVETGIHEPLSRLAETLDKVN